jgi:hypothetical protein
MDTPAPYIPPVKNSGLAIWSLVLGILGLVLLLGCIGILFAIPAVICGHIAYGRIKRSNGTLEGQGLALAGLITGYVSIGFSILLLPMLAAIAIPNFVKARDTAQKNVCVNNLRAIDAAKQQWALENKKYGYEVPTEKDLDPYIKGGFASLHCPKDGIYSINSVDVAPTCSIPDHVLSQAYPQARSGYTGPARDWSSRSNLAMPNQRFGPFNSRSNFLFSPSSNRMMQIRAAQQKSLCGINLVMIRNAKQTWATINHEPPTAVPTEDDLLAYLPGRKFPVCPADGTYTIGALNEDPTCSNPEHIILPNNPAASPPK